MPKEIHPLLDPEKQSQARRYEREKRLLGLASLTLSLACLLSFYYSGLSARAAHWFLGKPVVWAFLIYVTLLLAVLVFVGFPLSFYASYAHEHKWKFSNQTVRGWLWEKAKSFGVSLLITYLILGLLLWIMARFAPIWWLFAGAGMALVSVVLATLFPIVILPIFNKYTAIEDKDLTDALEKILSREGLRSSGFFKQDTSRQTKKENAFLAGLGRTRRVVLADNLMRNMSRPEIESVIAHELGHYRRRHIWKGIGIGTLEQLFVFWVINLVMKALFPQFLSAQRWNLALLPMFVILTGVVSGLLFGPLGNALSRHFEKQADLYALENIKEKKAFMTALAGLADRNLSNAYPEWWVKILYYSHPPIGERLRTAELFGTDSDGFTH